MVRHVFVAELPDLIFSDDYESDLEGRRVRVRLRTTSDGVEILGDAPRPAEIERLLEALGAERIEQMLCG